MKRLCVVMLCSLLLFGMLPARASEQSRVIRVGYARENPFVTATCANETLTYAQKYLSRLAEFTGWTYEYVPNDWSACIQALREGRVDLVLPDPGNDHAGEGYTVSNQTVCQYCETLLCKADRTDLGFESPEDYQGLMVGLLADCDDMNGRFMSYEAQKGFTTRKRFYATNAGLLEALAAGEVDAAVTGDVYLDARFKALTRFGSAFDHMLISEAQPTLAIELNEAQRQLMLVDPFCVESMMDQYFSALHIGSVTFSKEEKQYIQSSPEIRVLFDQDDYPQEWYDPQDGQYKGLYPGLMEMIGRLSGLTFTAVAPDDESSWERIRNGEADLLVSAYRSEELSQTYHLQFTEPYYYSQSSLVTRRGGTKRSDLSVALLRSQAGVIDFVQKQYPSWRLVECATTDECVAKVRSGATDAALINTLVLQGGNYLNLYADLMNLSVIAVELPVSMALDADEPAILRTILNKTIKQMSNADVQSAALETMLDSSQTMSLRVFIARYPVMTGLVLAALVILLCIAVFLSIYNRAKDRQNKLLEEKNRELATVNLLASRLRRQSETDALTGLLNKATVENECEAFLSGLSPDGHAGLFVLDIDNFKLFNDQKGHQFGDMLLEEFGASLHRFCRDQDIVGRVGGDEFVILYKSVENRKLLEQRAQSICDACRNLNDSIVDFSCSIGIATYPEQGSSYHDLFQAADQAMYHAKNHGKSCYEFADD